MDSLQSVGFSRGLASKLHARRLLGRKYGEYYGAFYQIIYHLYVVLSNFIKVNYHLSRY